MEKVRLLWNQTSEKWNSIRTVLSKNWWYQHLNQLFPALCIAFFAAARLLGRNANLGIQVMLLAVFGLFISDIVYCFKDVRRRFLLLLFLCSIFTFLLGRPIIAMFRGESWYLSKTSGNLFAYCSLFLTLIFLRLGSVLGHKLWDNQLHAMPSMRKPEFLYALQAVSFYFFLVTMLFRLLPIVERLIYMHGRSYAEYYLFGSQLPYFVTTIGSMSKYGLCIFLATLPEKRISFAVLASNVLCTVPSLLLGARMPFVSNVLFAFVYYLLRDNIGGAQKWIGKWEKRLIVIGAPAGLLVLGALNYLRDGVKAGMRPIKLIIDFFYKQGVSFRVLQIGYDVMPVLPGGTAKNYTFGPFIDYFCHGTFAQKLFGALPLGTGNNTIKAVFGHSFADSMSYVAHEGYLSGNGWGSSYLLETYADWGYWGIIVFSILLGLLLASILVLIRRKPLVRTIVLLSLLELLIIPRASAMGWLLFLVTAQFWASILVCYVGAWLLCQIRKKGLLRIKIWYQ